jgi:hypothetical protein
MSRCRDLIHKSIQETSVEDQTKSQQFLAPAKRTLSQIRRSVSVFICLLQRRLITVLLDRRVV